MDSSGNFSKQNYGLSHLINPFVEDSKILLNSFHESLFYAYRTWNFVLIINSTYL